eukprot:GEMP01071902.1.p1 GENE.GEMP01071902.1~~GEMP01071902.1.p1  ORF type:complete len:103 (+),score=2.40 GEMP01071902.1:901-1209(+)
MDLESDGPKSTRNGNDEFRRKSLLSRTDVKSSRIIMLFMLIREKKIIWQAIFLQSLLLESEVSELLVYAMWSIEYNTHRQDNCCETFYHAWQRERQGVSNLI